MQVTLQSEARVNTDYRIRAIFECLFSRTAAESTKLIAPRYIDKVRLYSSPNSWPTKSFFGGVTGANTQLLEQIFSSNSHDSLNTLSLVSTEGSKQLATRPKSPDLFRVRVQRCVQLNLYISSGQ